MNVLVSCLNSFQRSIEVEGYNIHNHVNYVENYLCGKKSQNAPFDVTLTSKHVLIYIVWDT